MSNRRSYDEQEKYLISKGVKELNSYSLINNYGYTFILNDIKYDLRYWANCYGCALNYWSIDRCGQSNEVSNKAKDIETYFNYKFR